MKLTRNWQALLSLTLLAFSLTQLPFTELLLSTAYLPKTRESLIAVVLIASSSIFSMVAGNRLIPTLAFGLFSLLGALELLDMLSFAEGSASLGYFTALAAAWLMAWRLVTVLSGDGSRGSGEGWLGRLGVPALFGLWILILWEAVTRGAGVPFVLLPPPSAIGARFMASLPTERDAPR